MSTTVPIKVETLKSFADEARRISGSADELSTDEMLDIFSVSALPNSGNVKTYATENEMLLDSPVSNTIGIVTETTVSSCLFSVTEPENPPEGMLWIQTGYDTEPFLADSIEVCPINAKQFISEEWTPVAAMTYANGTWNRWKVPLYSNGDEYKSWTGGWKLKDLSYAGTTAKAPTITRNADYVELKQTSASSGGVYHCVQPISLTGRKTLYFDGILQSANASLPSWVGISLWSSFGETIGVNQIKQFSSPVSGAVSFDIEQFNGEYFIGIIVYQANSTATLRKLYIV